MATNMSMPLLTMSSRASKSSYLYDPSHRCSVACTCRGCLQGVILTPTPTPFLTANQVESALGHLHVCMSGMRPCNRSCMLFGTCHWLPQIGIRSQASPQPSHEPSYPAFDSYFKAYCQRHKSDILFPLGGFLSISSV